MAEAVRKERETGSPGLVMLKLTEEEAETIFAVGQYVGGSMTRSRRGFYESVMRSLSDVGVETGATGDVAGRSNGVFFKDSLEPEARTLEDMRLTISGIGQVRLECKHCQYDVDGDDGSGSKLIPGAELTIFELKEMAQQHSC